MSFCLISEHRELNYSPDAQTLQALHPLKTGACNPTCPRLTLASEPGFLPQGMPRPTAGSFLRVQLVPELHKARPNSAQDAEGRRAGPFPGIPGTAPAPPLPSSALLAKAMSWYADRSVSSTSDRTCNLSNLLLKAAISANRRQVSRSSACERGADVNSYFT